MMDMEEFAARVLAAVKEKMGDGFDAWLKAVTKNNGVKLAGLILRREGAVHAPCIYLEEYFERYREGRTGINGAAEEICREFLSHEDGLKGIDVKSFRKWEAAKGRIHARLVNGEKNRELLRAAPHRQFLDMAVAYYIKMEIDKDISGFILVRDSLKEMWGQEEGSLYEAALANMRLAGAPLFVGMASMLSGILPEAGLPLPKEAAPVPPMYVLTNRSKMYGAAEILDGKTLKEIGGKLSDDFIVLPSSLHEVIIIPSGEGADYAGLSKIVGEINRSEVAEGERLSDHVYLYSREEEKLRIAA